MIDEFSYGIMMIHMFSGRWPEPQVGPSRVERGKLIPVTEAERRKKFVETIEDGHPLMDLIHRCINNDPQLRPHAGEIVSQVSQIASRFPASFANRLEMLRRIETVEEQSRVLREEKDVVFQQKEVRIVTLQQEVKQKAWEIERLNVVYASEIGQAKLEVQDLNSQIRLLEVQNEAKVGELNDKIAVSEKQIKDDEKHLQRYEVQLSEERDFGRTLAENNQILSSEVAGLTTTINTLQHKISTLEADISKKDTTITKNTVEVEASARNIQEKDAIIAGMKEELAKAREYLTTKQQV